MQLDWLTLELDQGSALRNILFGQTSPSARYSCLPACLLVCLPACRGSTPCFDSSHCYRLPFSWPSSLADLPAISNYTMHGRTYRYNQSNGGLSSPDGIVTLPRVA